MNIEDDRFGEYRRTMESIERRVRREVRAMTRRELITKAIAGS